MALGFTRIATGTLAILSLVTVGCLQQSDRQSDAELNSKRSGTESLIVGTAFDIQSVNELIDPGSSALNTEVVYQLFLKLADESPEFGSGPPSYTPRLAESWELSEDRRQLTFHIRPGVVWSDGVPVTAQDVRFSWEAQTHPKIGWAYGMFKEPIRNVEILDEKTVVFHYDEPTPTQLGDAVEGVILPSHVWSKLPFDEWRDNPQWFQENLVTNGPFLLDEWTPDEVLRLTRNPNYYEEGVPRLGEVVFSVSADRAGLVDRLMADEVDLIRLPGADDLQRIRDDPRLQLVKYNSRAYDFISWNTQRSFFEDPSVRRALALAIDRQALVDTLHAGEARIGVTPIVSWIWPHNENLQPWPLDLEESRRLLREAGWTDSNGDGTLDMKGQEFSFELSTNAGNGRRWSALQMIQADLEKVGVEASPRQIEYSTLTSMNMSHNYDATLTGLTVDTTYDFSYTFHTQAKDGGFNFGSYSNPELDQVIDTINLSFDKEDVKDEILRVQSILHQDQPALMLWETPGILALAGDLKNVSPSAIGDFYDLRYWSR